MQERSHGKTILICALVLLCLVAISTYLTGGSYARYRVESNTEDGARVMKFGTLTIEETGDFTAETTGNQFIVTPGVDLEKKATVSFTGAEAAMYVFVKVEAAGFSKGDDNYTFGAVSGKISWKVDDGAFTYLNGTDSAYNVYYKILEPNEVLADCEIIEDSEVSVSENLKNSELTTFAESSHYIKFEAYAVQLDGFGDFDTEAEHALAAWTSVSAHV